MHACIVLVGVESDGRLIRCQVFYRMEVKGGGGGIEGRLYWT